MMRAMKPDEYRCSQLTDRVGFDNKIHCSLQKSYKYAKFSQNNTDRLPYF
jgi:hypothetical protein